MHLETFLKHWGIQEHPFRAEEAKDDPVYRRLMSLEMAHPDFEKIFGNPALPSTSVVFGEKGSGKTALRLLMEKRIKDHNASHPESQVYVANYDDLNAYIDALVRRVGNGKEPGEALREFRLADHMDAILSLIITRLTDFLLGDNLDLPKARKKRRRLRRMPAQSRLDFATLALLYDQPKAGNRRARWNGVRHALRAGKLLTPCFLGWLGLLLCGGSLVAAAAGKFIADYRFWSWMGAGAALCVGLVCLVSGWMVRLRSGSLARHIWQEVRVVEQSAQELRERVTGISLRDLKSIPLPLPGNQDSRYELFTRVMGILKVLDYGSLIVLVDRVDEPAAVNGQPGKMRSIIWPLLNNKFLQQSGVGVKLLLPIELGYLLRREDEDFFRKARLDKQNMIDRLEWSGHTLYDICNRRLMNCTATGAKVTQLNDLFDEDVSTQDITDALDQMKHPRDAFKFLYQVVQEHCQNVADAAQDFKISRSVLEHIRKQESQRVQDLYRGLAPA